MATLTSIIKDRFGNTRECVVALLPVISPTFATGYTYNGPERRVEVPSTGVFSLASVEPGLYVVEITDTEGHAIDLFQIDVPSGSASYDLAGLQSEEDSDRISPIYLKEAHSWKQTVRVRSTANLALSGLVTVDGVALGAGNRVLAMDQTVAAQNGIYIAASGAWARASDADTAEKLPACSAMLASEGTLHAGKIYRLTTTAAITLGTTSLAFSELTPRSSVASIDTSGSNFRFKDGQLQFWDSVAYASDNTKPWRALGVNDGQTVWTAPILD